MKTVLITTSGTGDRLGTFTKYTNKSLVNVGDKYAICHIIENYDVDTEFIITIGYFGNIVKDFLLLAYPKHNFIFIEIDNYVGPGSSLGYSLLKAAPNLQKPFIFHCCDAIITNPIQFDETQNTLCVVKYDSSEQYTNILVAGDYIKEINPKQFPKYDYIYTGISFIYNYCSFWENLQEIYNSDRLNSSLSDVDSIRQMLKKHEFKYIVLDKWYDTGNKQSYANLQNYFKSSYDILVKSNESLCFFDNIVIKFINDIGINKKRFERGKILGNLTPKLLNHSDNFIVMEKIEGIVLSKYYKQGEIYRLLNWAKENLWINEQKSDIFKKECYDFYIKKTNTRIKSLNYLDSEINIINGINTGSISELMNKVEQYDKLFTDIFYNFHGDFILDNIIKTRDSYKLIDWRHEFGSLITHGDIYYDLAKLRHNIIFNHENILNKLYEIKYISIDNCDKKNDTIEIDLKCNYFFMQQLDEFDRFILENNYDLRKIKVLMSVIWLNMSPLYENELSQFLFYFGKYNLSLLL
jgi:NDP-sugar pyrophosphorylase family protein